MGSYVLCSAVARLADDPRSAAFSTYREATDSRVCYVIHRCNAPIYVYISNVLRSSMSADRFTHCDGVSENFLLKKNFHFLQPRAVHAH